jgi:hypothetical protein
VGVLVVWFGVEVGAHHVVYPAQNAELPRVARFLAWIEREAATEHPRQS